MNGGEGGGGANEYNDGAPKNSEEDLSQLKQDSQKKTELADEKANALKEPENPKSPSSKKTWSLQKMTFPRFLLDLMENDPEMYALFNKYPEEVQILSGMSEENYKNKAYSLGRLQHAAVLIEHDLKEALQNRNLEAVCEKICNQNKKTETTIGKIANIGTYVLGALAVPFVAAVLAYQNWTVPLETKASEANATYAQEQNTKNALETKLNAAKKVFDEKYGPTIAMKEKALQDISNKCGEIDGLYKKVLADATVEEKTKAVLLEQKQSVESELENVTKLYDALVNDNKGIAEKVNDKEETYNGEKNAFEKQQLQYKKEIESAEKESQANRDEKERVYQQKLRGLGEETQQLYKTLENILGDKK